MSGFSKKVWREVRSGRNGCVEDRGAEANYPNRSVAGDYRLVRNHASIKKSILKDVTHYSPIFFYGFLRFSSLRLVMV